MKLPLLPKWYLWETSFWHVLQMSAHLWGRMGLFWRAHPCRHHPPTPQHRQEVHHGGCTTLVVTQGQSVSPYFQINISWTKTTTQVKSKLLQKHSYNCFSFLTLGNHSILLFSFNFFLIDNSRPQLKAPWSQWESNFPRWNEIYETPPVAITAGSILHTGSPHSPRDIWKTSHLPSTWSY